MEVNTDQKTMECLRGRLLAERQASKIAKQDSERLENKLVELEKMLKEEIKMRNKAEKRLNFFRKKLERLNLLAVDESDESSSSSSSSYFEKNCNNSESDFNNATNSVTSQDFSRDNNNTSEVSISSQNGNNYTPSSTSSNSPQDYQNRCDDESLALALVPMQKSIDAKRVHENNVEQVLDSLRYIRETIQSSLEMRRMVRVGPT